MTTYFSFFDKMKHSLWYFFSFLHYKYHPFFNKWQTKLLLFEQFNCWPILLEKSCHFFICLFECQFCQRLSRFYVLISTKPSMSICDKTSKMFLIHFLLNVSYFDWTRIFPVAKLGKELLCT